MASISQGRTGASAIDILAGSPAVVLMQVFQKRETNSIQIQTSKQKQARVASLCTVKYRKATFGITFLPSINMEVNIAANQQGVKICWLPKS